MTAIGLRTTGLAVIVAPLLLLASTLAYVANGQGLSEGEAAGAIQIWAFIAFGVAVVGLARAVEAHAPRAGAVLSVLGIVGAAGGVAYGMDSIQVAVLDGSIAQSSVTPFALRLPGLAFPLSFAALGVLLARHHLVPVTAGYGLAIGAVLFPVSRIPDVAALAIAADVLVVVSMAAIGLHLLASRRSAAVAGRSPTEPAC